MEENALIFELLNEGHDRHRPPLMIDVGGHYGESSIPYANSGWDVFIFEPDEKNRQALLKSMAHMSSVKILSSAVSDVHGREVPWFESKESTGISGLNAFRDSHVQSNVVTTTTLKHFTDSYEIKRVDFLKIDAEGHDLFVLKGFDWENSQLMPRVLVCEFEDRKTVPMGYTWTSMAELLREQGYNVIVSEWYPIVRYGMEHRWRRFQNYPCELHSADAWGNLIALRLDGDFRKAQLLCEKYSTEHRRLRRQKSLAGRLIAKTKRLFYRFHP